MYVAPVHSLHPNCLETWQQVSRQRLKPVSVLTTTQTEGTEGDHPLSYHTGTTHTPNSSSLSVFVVGRCGSFCLRGSWLPAGCSCHTELELPPVSVALYLRGSRVENPDTGSEAGPRSFPWWNAAAGGTRIQKLSERAHTWLPSTNQLKWTKWVHFWYEIMSHRSS